MPRCRDASRAAEPGFLPRASISTMRGASRARCTRHGIGRNVVGWRPEIMEDRISEFLYLELSNRPIDAYARERVPQVLALPGALRATWWRNQKPGRTEFPRTIDEFTTLGVYEADGGFAAPPTPPD